MGKYQSYVKVNIDALEHNYFELKRICYPSKISAVVKANAYGLGAVTIARELEKIGLDYLCVANVNEALELRNNDIFLPILVLGYIADDFFKAIVQNRIEVTAYNFEHCKKINEEAKKLDAIVDVHIKIDTGMGRLGYLIDEKNIDSTIKEIKKISELSNIRIKGIYSHLSDADGEDFSYTKKQYEKFMNFIKLLEKENISIPIKHISNDAGAIVHGYYLDMIRSGIGIYGYYPSKTVEYSNKVKLEAVASLFTTVSSVKVFEEGESIGYNRTFKTNKVTKIATIAIGYADGYPIQLSNKGYVKIKGQKAKIIGKVCMDQTMVDVSNIEDINIGDSVLLYGKDEYGELPIYEIANLANTIVYDLICGITMRIPRIYIKDNKVLSVINYLKH
ncbi:alanine racemase [Miniphocaeibacter halophilus]|uniref:Alanine racemase n=1 Tax=Miniphocaeibacter halophilus TaxID=2931922 RepID=A0AC61MPH9_9FIRM|nr:alanine racemase [Miniphocaeibacter halophilus]QQK07475.1 alanine racemase [Miniphocaeibacter halophilus]